LIYFEGFVLKIVVFIKNNLRQVPLTRPAEIPILRTARTKLRTNLVQFKTLRPNEYRRLYTGCW